MAVKPETIQVTPLDEKLIRKALETVEKHLAKALRVISSEMKASSGVVEVADLGEHRFWKRGRG